MKLSNDYLELKAMSQHHKDRVRKAREAMAVNAFVETAIANEWGDAGGDAAVAAASRRSLIMGPFAADKFSHSFDTSSAGMMQGSATSANQEDDEFDNPGMGLIQAGPDGAGMEGFSAITGMGLDATEQAAVDAERERRLGLDYAEGQEDELTAAESMQDLLDREDSDFDNQGRAY
jgi:hypothetical protein